MTHACNPSTRGWRWKAQRFNIVLGPQSVPVQSEPHETVPQHFLFILLNSVKAYTIGVSFELQHREVKQLAQSCIGLELQVPEFS